MEETWAVELATCMACRSGFHEECLQPSDDDEQGFITCCCTWTGEVHDPGKDASTSEDDEEEKRGVGRPQSDPSKITDPVSAGRKRAARLYPIYPGMVCEWAGLKFAGGGIHPIVGCAGNTIEDSKSGSHAGHRHHGPDKNTLSNQPGNLHRVCTTCHNRFHALNNPTYEGERPDPPDRPWLPAGDWHPHDPVTQATDEERRRSDEWFASHERGSREDAGEAYRSFVEGR